MSKEELHYTCDDALAHLVESLVATENEGTYWDYKREWHTSKSDLVHDIICLANNPDNETALLIIGIDENDAYKVYDVVEHAENRKNTQQVNNVLRTAHWAESYPNVRVVSTPYVAGTIDVLVIEPDGDAVPYYLLSDYGKGKQTVRAGAIYVRQQDGNIPKNETATALVTERLWQRHFGIDKTPLERLPQLLSRPDDWRIPIRLLTTTTTRSIFVTTTRAFPNSRSSEGPRKTRTRSSISCWQAASSMVPAGTQSPSTTIRRCLRDCMGPTPIIYSSQHRQGLL
jgi:hypothetical protein